MVLFQESWSYIQEGLSLPRELVPEKQRNMVNYTKTSPASNGNYLTQTIVLAQICSFYFLSAEIETSGCVNFRKCNQNVINSRYKHNVIRSSHLKIKEPKGIVVLYLIAELHANMMIEIAIRKLGSIQISSKYLKQLFKS